MNKLRISSYIIFHLLDAEIVYVQDSEELHQFHADMFVNKYERLRGILALLDDLDETPAVYADLDGMRQTFQIDRGQEPDEEIINFIETGWALNRVQDYQQESNEECLVTFMRYMMEDADCRDDLWSCWNHGEFSSIQFEWPDCPPEAFYFSDTELFAHVG